MQPLGLAEQGLYGHRTRFRLANVTLSELAATMPGVYVVDVAAALGAAGYERMLDDGFGRLYAFRFSGLDAAKTGVGEGCRT